MNNIIEKFTNIGLNVKHLKTNNLVRVSIPSKNRFGWDVYSIVKKNIDPIVFENNLDIHVYCKYIEIKFLNKQRFQPERI